MPAKKTGKSNTKKKKETAETKAPAKPEKDYTGILVLLGVVIVVAIAAYLLMSSRDPTSCFNGKQDQGEENVDCGGPCSKPCQTSTTNAQQNQDCGSLTEITAKTRCYVDKAATQGSDSECTKLSDIFYRNMCYRLYASKTLDSTSCANINTTLDADECYKDVAISKQDVGVCDKVSDEAQRDTCFFRLGFDTKNADICNKIISTASKYRCLALAKKDYTYCRMINETKGRDYCFERTSTLVPVIDVCADIINPSIKDSCTMTVAEKTINSKLCGNLSNSSLEKVCGANVEKAREQMTNMQQQILGNNTQLALQPA